MPIFGENDISCTQSRLIFGVPITVDDAMTLSKQSVCMLLNRHRVKHGIFTHYIDHEHQSSFNM